MKRTHGSLSMTRRAATVSALLFLAASSPADAGALTLAPGVLRIGTYFVNPPFEYISRRKKVGFEVDLMNEINSSRAPQIRSLADLKDAEVGVQAATTDYDVAIAMQQRGEIAKVEVYPFDRIAEAMTDLAAGHITAVMKVYPVAAWLARRTPGLRIVAQVPNDPQPLGIGFNKNNPRLLAAVNSALSGMKQDGTYARLARKWGVP